jgi:hypothetical protein
MPHAPNAGVALMNLVSVMIVGMIMKTTQVELRPTGNASKRTRERIAQHGPTFDVQRTDWPIAMNGAQSILVKSIKSGWLGWLPLNEVER